MQEIRGRWSSKRSTSASAPAAQAPKLIFTPSPVQFRGSTQRVAPSDPPLCDVLCSSHASVTQHTSAGGKLGCLCERRKKTQLCERVTHLDLSLALRNRLALIGCYWVNTHVRLNMLWNSHRVFYGLFFYVFVQRRQYQIILFRFFYEIIHNELERLLNVSPQLCLI